MFDCFEIGEGFGGGSYFEPFMKSIPECDICGSDYDVDTQGESAMCADCRGKMYAKDSPSLLWEFVTKDFDTLKEFLVDYWFGSMDDTEKVDLLRKVFVLVNTMPNFKIEAPSDKNELLCDFVLQFPSDLAKFVENGTA